MINHKLWNKIIDNMESYVLTSGPEKTLDSAEIDAINAALEAIDRQFQKIRPIVITAENRFKSVL